MVTHDPLTKAEVLSTSFLRKQVEAVDKFLSYLYEIYFLCIEVLGGKVYLNDLDTSRSSDPHQIFPTFPKNIAAILAPKVGKDL